MASEQKGYVTYGDFETTADELTDEQLGQIFRAKLRYFNHGEVPDFTGELKFVWIPIQQQMDRDTDKYNAKCARMKANAEKRWNDANASKSMQLDANASNTNTKTNTKTKTETNTMPSETGLASTCSFLIGYLNEKTGSNYYQTVSVQRAISNLLDSGYTVDQIRTVIDKKCADWLGDEKMRGYLRPSTLFGEKFAEYLAAPISLSLERERDTEKKKSSLKKELSEKQSALSVLRASLDEIPRGTRMDERRELKDQIAILEDSIGLIERRLS